MPTTPRTLESADRLNLSVLMVPAQVSAYLGIPTGTLANWRYQGRGPAFVRVGRHVRYRSEDISEWIDQQVGALGTERSARGRRTASHSLSFGNR